MFLDTMGTSSPRICILAGGGGVVGWRAVRRSTARAKSLGACLCKGGTRSGVRRRGKCILDVVM